MIRHVTFSSVFVEMKKEGYLRPSGMYPDSSGEKYIAFEKDWIGDAYFKAIYIAKNAVPGVSFSPGDLMALIFNEQDLLVKGYQIHERSEIERRSRLESMLSRGDISPEEYKEIGKLVYIKNEIPLDYIVDVDIPSQARLNKLGLA